MTDEATPQPPEKPKAPKLEVRSPRPYKPQPGEPPMHLDRLQVYLDNPSEETERHARKLLEHCGDLVLDGVQYRIRKGAHPRHPRRDPGPGAPALAKGIDKLKLETVEQLRRAAE